MSTCGFSNIDWTLCQKKCDCNTLSRKVMGATWRNLAAPPSALEAESSVLGTPFPATEKQPPKARAALERLQLW